MTGMPVSWARFSTGSVSFTSIGTRPITSTFWAISSSKSFTCCPAPTGDDRPWRLDTEIFPGFLHAILKRIEPGDAGDLDDCHHLLLVVRKGQAGDPRDADDGDYGSGSEEFSFCVSSWR
jgi:hypothetical protein